MGDCRSLAAVADNRYAAACKAADTGQCAKRTNCRATVLQSAKRADTAAVAYARAQPEAGGHGGTVDVFFEHRMTLHLCRRTHSKSKCRLMWRARYCEMRVAMCGSTKLLTCRSYRSNPSCPGPVRLPRTEIMLRMFKCDSSELQIDDYPNDLSVQCGKRNCHQLLPVRAICLIWHTVTNSSL